MFLFFGFGSFPADLGEFAGIQPVTSAVWAFVDLDFAQGAEKVAVQFDPGATGTFAFAGNIDGDGRVDTDVQQRFARVVDVVELLQFESVEPDATAAILAGIDSDAGDLQRRQFIKAGRAFHTQNGLSQRSITVRELSRAASVTGLFPERNRRRFREVVPDWSPEVPEFWFRYCG